MSAFYVKSGIAAVCVLGVAILPLRVMVLAVVLVTALYVILKEWSRPPPPSPNRDPSTLSAQRYTPEKVSDEEFDYVVIGSGMSGLTCAAVLSRSGHRVLVLEQHEDHIGGGTHMYSLGGYKFDSGLHYTIPWSGPLLRVAAGSGAQPVVTFEKMGEADGTFDRIVIGNREPFCVQHNEAHLPQLRRMFPSVADQQGLDAYMTITNSVLKGTPWYVLSKFFPLWLQRVVWRVFLTDFAKYAGQKGLDVLKQIFPATSHHLISLLCGLWIDTGARPDTGTFFLLASVFRGLPHEGGAYPIGGSEAMAEALVQPIKRAGGRVLVNARVEEILIENGQAVGVRMQDDTAVRVRRGVVCSANRCVTYGKLIPREVCAQYGIKVDKEDGFALTQSAGFVMVNIGLKGKAADLGITNTNLWYHPADANDDIIAPLQRFMEHPYQNDFPCMLTFPSVKDQTQRNGDTTTCQVLIFADHSWFEQWKHDPHGNRADEYQALKNDFRTRAIATLARFYPKTKDAIDYSDVSTPLSIEYYLNAPHGAAVGLDPSPERYSGDWEIIKQTDSISPIPGIAVTGQDTLICGVIMAQAAGLATALRLLGPIASAKFMARTALYAD